MQKKYDRYEQLADNALNNLLSSRDNWLSFLNTAAKMYKYSFDEQLLIHAQRPDTRACASFEFWTSDRKMNRHIKRNSEGIALLDRERHNLYYVYAVEDTEARKNGKSRNPEDYIWKMQPDHEKAVSDMITENYGISTNNVQKSLALMASAEAEKYMADYTVQLLEKMHELDLTLSPDMQKAFSDALKQSAAYILLMRCGYDADSMLNDNAFESLNQFDSRFSIIIGQALNTIANNAVRQVERIVGLPINQKRSNENDQRITSENQNQERNRVYSGRGNTDISPELSGGRAGSDRQVRKNERELPQEPQGRKVHGTASIQQTDTASGGDRRTGEQEDRQHSTGNGGSGRNGRGPENARPIGMGGQNEQLQELGRGNSSQRTDLRLSKDLTAEVKAASAVSVITDSEFSEKIHAAFEEVGRNRKYTGKQQKFMDRLENFIVKRHITENIIDEMEKLPAFQNHYGNRKNLSRNLFAGRLSVLEKELTEAIHAQLTETTAEKNLNQDTDFFRIYQIKRDSKYHGIRFQSFTENSDAQLNYEDYDLVYEGNWSDIDRTSAEEKLNAIYSKFNINIPEDFKGHSLSVSDVIVVGNNDVQIAHYVDNFGFSDFNEFFQEKEITLKEDLLDKAIRTEYGDTTVDENIYDSLDDMNAALGNLEFDELVALSDEEKNKFITPDIQLKHHQKQSETNNESESQLDFFSQTNDKTPSSSTLHNFHITDNELGEGGAKTKFTANITAIETLKKVEAEERFASAEEQALISKYVGWGGLPQAFDQNNEKWKNEYEQLKNLLTPEEYSSAKGSVLNAHFTAPDVIEEIYNMLENNGFKGGRILEPAVGTGNFFGKMPENISENSQLYGVELDSLTGRMAKQLYQTANISVSGFEKMDFKDNSFDLAVGNVPFGSYKLSEKRYDKLNLNIHDHFFAKSLDKVKPGGIIAFITSKGTLDKKSPDVRKYIAQRAELVGAVRLPNNAFKANAGTEVTADIIILQKRENPIELTPEATPDWVYLGQTEDGLPINQYFSDNPDMVLGKVVPGNKLYGHVNDDTMCIPIEGADLKENLHKALSNIHFEIMNADELISEEAEAPVIDIPMSTKNYSYVQCNDKLYYRENSEMTPFTGSDSAAERIKGLIEIRDSLRALIDCQLNNADNETVSAHQNVLNRCYDKFTAKYGLINSKTNQKIFKDDVSLPLISSLEIIRDGKLAGKAPIFEKRTIKPKTTITSVDTSSEALAVSLSEKAKVDIDFMMQLTGFTAEKIKEDLRGVIFENPIITDSNGNPRLETSDEYLSGNIREKLEFMKTYFSDNPRYSHNIEALEIAMPKPLEAADIDIRLGATWIEPKIIQQFVYETLNTPRYYRDMNYNSSSAIKVDFSPFNAEWNISNKTADRDNLLASTTYGTSRRNAYQLIEECLNLRDARVMDKVIKSDGKEGFILNSTETELAQEKQKELQNAFKEWVFKDVERRQELVEKYNILFNSTKPREYDGSHLEFPGMNSEIKLREHQKNAIAHALYGGNTLFAHEVGAGKTYEMIATAMEGKRLGLHNKSLIAVPNHLTEQIAGDFIKLYPNANILVASADDFKKENRKKLFGKIATGDFDAIIIGHSQLIKIPVSRERQEKLIRKQINEIIDGVANLKMSNNESFQIKQMERTRKSLEAKLDKLLNSPVRDDVIDFEELGVDKLFVDEAHLFKNLFLSTKMRNISGISTNDNVQKTQDLYLKCQYLDELTGGKGITFATGTPVSNSISEIYSMMKYLQSDLLEKSGMKHFDAWAANFAETVTDNQLAPEGNGYQLKTRFSNFNNLPELMNMFKECADIKTADMLNLPVPECEMTTIVAQPTETQKDLIFNLGERAKRVRQRSVDPKEDNMPMITNDGRKIGLDQRLMNPDLPDQPGTKINLCVDNVFRIWNETSENRSTQLIFCDLGVPQSDADMKKKGRRFSVYDDIKQKLIAKGVPEKEIAFIHDAKTEAAKDSLFSKVRSGDIRVLIGSTSKMGAGTNVQDKLIASHDLDAPWKPADMEQRRGRMVRQGNENKKVNLYRYVTEGTFDAYLYQILENKQVFASQIMASKSPVRSCKDVDDVALSFAEIKALSAGNPLIKEKMDLDVEIAKLKRLKANFQNTQFELEDKVLKKIPLKISGLREHIEAIKKDISDFSKIPESVDENGNTVFTGITISGNRYYDKNEAGAELLSAIQKTAFNGSSGAQKIGEYQGFDITAHFDIGYKQFVGELKGAASHKIEFGSSPTGNITRLDNVLNSMQHELEKEENHLNTCTKQLQDAQGQLGQKFPYEEQLKEKNKRLTELTKLLDIDGQKDTTNKDSEITDPYYIEINSDMLEKLKKSNANFEHSEKDGHLIIKINRADKEKIHSIIDTTSTTKLKL